jgi:glycosyltransferase involved in cell wall biosynthesis
MGAKGRAHVSEGYTVERMCADTLALYEELIAGQISRPAV